MKQRSDTLLSMIKKVCKILLFFGVGIFFIWLSIRKLSPSDIENLKESAKQVTRGSAWIFLTLAFLAGVVSNYVRALRNRQLLEPLGYDTRRSMVFYSVMVCYLANYAFPRLGEVLRCTFLQRYEKVPFQKSLGTVVTERAVDLILLIIVLLSALLINTGLLDTLEISGITLRETLRNKFESMVYNTTLFWIIGGGVAAIVIIILTQKWWSTIPFFVKIKNFFVGIWQGLISIKDVKRIDVFVFYSLFIWLLWILETVFCFQAFDFLKDKSFLVMFTVFAMGNIGFLIGPGGIGIYPLIVASMLSLYGVDYSAGLAAGWIGWGIQTLNVLLVGGFSLIATSFVQKRE